MKLSDDKARRLSWLVWRDRARRCLPVVALGAVLLAAVVFATEKQIEHADPTIAVLEHSATVVDMKRTMGHGAAVMRVHLDDGRDVDAASLFRVAPFSGVHVIVNEARHASGRLTYDVARFATSGAA